MSRQLERVLARMNRIPVEVRKALEPALQKSATELVTEQKRLAPKDEHHLEQTIRQEPGPHEASVRMKAGGPATTTTNEAGDAYDYALGQEFGTSDMPANPFFLPAYRLLRKRITLRMKRAVRKATRDHWGSTV